MNLVETIEALGKQWLAAKAAEDEAKANRLAVEESIAAAMPATSDESTNKIDIRAMRITVKYGVTRSVDSDRLQDAWAGLAKEAHGCFKWKAAVDLKALRGVQQLRPDVYATIASYVTVKPSKPSVEVVIEEKEAA
jgi:hypothetical protein